MSVSVVKKGELEGSSHGPYVHGFPYISVVEASPEILQGDRRFLLADQKKVGFGDVNEKNREEKDVVNDSCSSSTSSIGKNSDLSEGSLEKSDDTEEVQSSLKAPLDSIEPLEEALPISRRGISRFYNGRSKSFTTLREASSSSSIKELAKPENAYIRKRRNLLACALYLDNNGKTKSSPFRYHGGGISKKGANFSKTSLALATAMTCSSASTNDEMVIRSSPAISRLNPLFKGCQGNGLQSSPYSLSTASLQQSLAWRSFSLADLQQCQHVSVSTSSKGAVNQLQMNQSS